MKHYYAIFKKTDEAIEVAFPDLESCVTFAHTWDEALENATDVLALWLANAKPQFIHPPSTHAALSRHLKENETLVPVAIDEKIFSSYQELKRFNVIFPKEFLEEVDDYKEKFGLKRSKLLQLAAEEYIARHRNHPDDFHPIN